MNNSSILEVLNLSVEFKTDNNIIKAVDNISFSIKKGQVTGIVGESGSGKSITSLSILGLIPSPPGKITDGSIFYKKNDEEKINLLKLPEKELLKYRGKEIAMIFQEPMTSLNPVFTCGNQVREAILSHQKISKKEAKERTVNLFNEVQLPDPERIYKSYPHELSGGQKQRVMIAMAISCNPSILIADEPTTALDVTVQKNILSLLKSLQQKYGMSIIFISHDLGVISEIADNIIVMYKGKIVEQNPASEIFSNPRHPYTKSLLACRPPTDRYLKFLPTVSDFMTTDDKGEIKEKQGSITEFINNITVDYSTRKINQEEIYKHEPILRIRGVKKYYPVNRNFFGTTTSYNKAVDDIDFEVYQGETLGLVGESGCGKTTLGRVILNLINSTEGEILYKGINISRLSGRELRKLRQNIQIVFQDPYSSLNPRLTIGSAIMEPMQVHKLNKNNSQRKDKTFELLEKVNLDRSYFNRYPHELSGGQRQRICIARALALNPEFIVCDESVSSLDVSIQAQILNLLNDLKKQFNFTYIFISHDLSVVRFMSDRIIVMKDGKIQEIGDANDVYLNPQTQYTKNLIKAIPAITK